jgi:hypothetical protein
MPKGKIRVLPRQLALFDIETLEACTETRLGRCPKCASKRVYIQRRVRVIAEKLCGECAAVWVG